MKLTGTASALLLALVVTPTFAKYENCNAAEEQALRTAASDAIKITDLVIAALDGTALLSVDGTASSPKEPLDRKNRYTEFQPIRPAYMSALAERYFGAPNSSDTFDGIINTTQIRDHYKGMNTMLREEDTLYVCAIQQTCDRLAGKMKGGHSGYKQLEAYVQDRNLEHNTWIVETHSPRIHYCPVVFEKGEAWDEFAAGWWLDSWGPWQDQNFSTSTVIIHESSHVMLSDHARIVQDIAPFWNKTLWGPHHTSPYGPANAQLLAIQDPRLAVRNADNYALFAVEVALTSIFDILPYPAALDLVVLPRPLQQQIADRILDRKRVTPQYLADYMKPAYNNTRVLQQEELSEYMESLPLKFVDGSESTGV